MPSCIEAVGVEVELARLASRCAEKNSGVSRAAGLGAPARRVEADRQDVERSVPGPAGRDLSQLHGRAGPRSRGSERTAGGAVAGRSISCAWLVGGGLEHVACEVSRWSWDEAGVIGGVGFWRGDAEDHANMQVRPRFLGALFLGLDSVVVAG